MAARGEEMGNPNPKPMVQMEMDAALALTEMAKIETTESGRLETKKRVKNGFPDLEISRSNKHACLVGDHPQDNEVSAAVEEGRVKIEHNAELSTSNIRCNSSQRSCFGRTTKQNMTEAEKEARRIRRVLANRESARQTIRRRQTLQEELVKKVADLSIDNENMKMEKELAMKEYLSLKDRNKQLKEQMDRTVNCKVKVGVEIASTQPETSSSPSPSPSPSTELSLVPSTELSLVSSSKTPWPSIHPGHEEGNQSSASASRTHFYVPSQTWFYPLHRHTSPSDHPSFFHPSNDVDSVGRQQHCGRPVFQKMDHSERRYMHDGNKPSVPSTEVTSSEVTNTRINLEELPIEYEGPDNLSHGVAEREVALHKKAEKKTGVPHKAMPRKEQSMFIQSRRKTSVDPAVAAEARKRRKELKKLKFLQGRRIRLHG